MSEADVHCSSPTCRAAVLVPIWWPEALVEHHLQATGWRRQQQPGDDRPLPYCPRCQL